MIVATSCCRNYLPKAATLATSLKAVMPDVSFVLCLVEREVPPAVREIPAFDEVIAARDLGFERFENLLFRHTIVEAATAVKGRLLEVLLDREAQRRGPGTRGVLYLDPDTCVYSRLAEVEQLIGRGAEIVLTPHLTIPEQKDTHEATLDAVRQNEICALQHGVYNLGFLGLSPGRTSHAFLQWWSARLAEFCEDKIAEGIFTDQKWIDLAPGFFDTAILRHPGYNMAPWNFSMRELRREKGLWEVEGEPLRFFHFSGLDSGAFEAMLGHFGGPNVETVGSLLASYREELVRNGQLQWGASEWDYARYLSGELISDEARRRLRSEPQLRARIRDPFLHSEAALLGSRHGAGAEE